MRWRAVTDSPGTSTPQGFAPAAASSSSLTRATRLGRSPRTPGTPHSSRQASSHRRPLPSRTAGKETSKVNLHHQRMRRCFAPPTHLSFCCRAAALCSGSPALFGGQRIHQPQRQGGGPVSSQVGDCVQKSHVGPAYEGVAHFGVKSHAGHIHAV